MEEEFTQTKPFVIHTQNKDIIPKLLRFTLFPYPMLDFANYDTRMTKIRMTRTGSLPNSPDAIREYLKNNRTVYLFLGDSEYLGSYITLRYFNDKCMIDRSPSKDSRSLVTWAIDNAYYKYITAIDNYKKDVLSGKIDQEQWTTDEVSDEPVPMLDDGLLDEFYRKLEAEARKTTVNDEPEDSLY